MKRALLAVSVVFLFVSLVPPQPVTAQGVDLTDNRTIEQKWTRSVVFVDFAWMGMIAYGKSMGRTPEQLGRWMGEWGSLSWGTPGEMSLPAFVRQMFLNYHLWDELEFDVLTENEREIRVRMNVPYASFFGEEGERYGVTLQEFQQVWCLTYEGIADYLGFDMSHEIGGDWIEFTVGTRS
jgi:hypothetical protein